MKERVLITGSQGFIGKQLHKSIDSTERYSICTLEEAFIANHGVSAIDQFLNELDPEIIFHVGACSNTLESDIQYMMEVNVLATMHFADWARSNNRTLIYSSSAACYGTSGIAPSNLYGWSKYVAERYVSAKGGVSLRYFNVFGPGEEKKGSMASMFFQAFNKYIRDEQVMLFPGRPMRDFVFVHDVVNANLQAAHLFDSISGGVFDVGTGISNSFETGLELMQIPYSYYPENKIPFGYQFCTKADTSKWIPGWKPLHDFRRNILEYKDFLRSTVVM